MGRVQDKVCIVTGAGSGIGRASAIRLAEEGGLVLVADVNLDGADETVAIIESAGGQARSRAVDVSDRQAVGFRRRLGEQRRRQHSRRRSRTHRRRH